VTALRKGIQAQRACNSRGRSLAYAWLADGSGWRVLASLVRLWSLCPPSLVAMSLPKVAYCA